MKNYPEYILKKLRQREGLEEDDTSEDDILNSYTKDRAFREVLMWDGLIGWDTAIKSSVKDIYGVDLYKID